MSAETISAREAAGLIAGGQAVLVDIREADERARSHIPGSAHAPASRPGSAALGVAPGSTVMTVNGSPAIRSPGGYLRALTDKARAGELALGPLLMALIGQRIKAKASARADHRQQRTEGD